MSSGPAAAARPTGALGRHRPARRAPRHGARSARPTATIVLVVVGGLFAVPLAALLVFTVQPVSGGGLTLTHYAALVDPSQEGTYEGLFDGIRASLAIAVVTVAIVLVLLVPAMLLVELRLPRARRALEALCLAPITVPTIVLVVGFVPVYRALGSVLGTAPWTLAFAVGVIVLPYAYRPIRADLDGLQLATLTEAARALGASEPRAVLRVVVPNLRRGILTACLLTVSVVLGEFTIANFLSQNTFQTALLLLQQTDPYVAAIVTLAALAFVFLLLTAIAVVGSARRTRRTRP